MAPDSDEEDYMSLSLPEPESTKFETSIQRKAREKREAEARSRPKSKAELASEAAKAREAGLSTHIDQSSKGFKMLQKLGYKPGSTLGAKDRLDARLEPIGVEIRDNREGIGLNTDRKRRFREEVEQRAKKMKTDETDFRERVASERENRRHERLWRAAASILEGLEDSGRVSEPSSSKRDKQREISGETNEERDTAHVEAVKLGSSNQYSQSMPLSSINVLYRGLVRQRRLDEDGRRLRHDLLQSLSEDPSYDSNADKERLINASTEVEDLIEDDPELAQFETLESATRLEKVVQHLRDSFHYCFWCKFTYPDSAMEGCPGVAEADHE